MFRNESEDNFNENTDLTELVEQFEKSLHHNEQIFFDEDALEQIMEYYEARMETLKLEKAVDYAISQNPYSSDFIIRKAEILLHKKKYDDAHALLDKAALFDSREIDIFLVRADIFMETHKLEEALTTLNEALDLSQEGEKEFVYAEMSHVYELMEDYDKAIKYLFMAVECNPENINILEDVAHLVDMTDKYDESIILHKKIIDKNPYSWIAWYNLGRAYAGMNLYEKALEAFDFSIAINEDFEYVYREAADVYFRLDNIKKAIEMFEAAQQHSPEFDDYSFRIGICYERIEEYKNARFHYRKATRTDPYHDEALFRIGETYRIEERYDAALVNYKKALRLDEQNELYLATLISIYQILENEDEIITHMYALVYARPEVLTYWIDIIKYLYETANYDEALEVCAEALLRCGSYAEFEYMESIVLFKTGKEREAFSKLENALIKDFARHTILMDVDERFYYHPRVRRIVELYGK
ncbi:MAG: tetratricopeptide repeat protein [Fimbriimonadaceae bacterium]|nr:tetratricopeptide repeat protein [Chitinophagales bacterium]